LYTVVVYHVMAEIARLIISCGRVDCMNDVQK